MAEDQAAASLASESAPETASVARREHDIKCHMPYFEDLLHGGKDFEVRRDDRGYATGDDLLIREWDATIGAYTGREQWFWVRYVLHGGAFGIEPGYVVMSVQKAPCLVTRDVRTPSCRSLRGHKGPHTTGYGDSWYDECKPETLGHHRGPWEHVKGTDSIDRCTACGREIGK